MMSGKPITKFRLTDLATGHHYAVEAELMVGRTSGDLRFPQDSQMSTRQCRLRPAVHGLEVIDLGSANGTRINQLVCRANQSHLLKVGDVLKVGEQNLRLEEVINRAERVQQSSPPRRRQWTMPRGVLIALGMMAAVAIVVTRHSTSISALLRAPLSSGYLRDLGGLLDRSSQLQRAFSEGQRDRLEVRKAIQDEVMAPAQRIQQHLAANDGPTDSNDHMLSSAELRLIRLLLAHAKANLDHLNSGELKDLEARDQLEDQLDQAVREIRLLPNPGANTFPQAVHTPQELVEREMRDALALYRRMGEDVRANKLSDHEMAKKIRAILAPKLTQVSNQMLVLKTATPAAQQRLNVEQRLVTAMLGQVQALASFTETKDDKFSQLSTMWADQVVTLDGELKNSITRGPAASSPAH